MQVFSEKQRFMRKGLALIIALTVVGLLGILAVALYRTWVLQKPTGLSVFNDQDLILLILFVTASALGLPLIFFAIRLESILEGQQLRLRFLPFKEVVLDIHQMRHCKKVKINAKAQFNGLGIRENDYGYALILLANDQEAIELEMLNGEKYLLSSRFPEIWLKHLSDQGVACS